MRRFLLALTLGGLLLVGGMVHVALVFAPLNLVFLWFSFQRHHNRTAIRVAGVGLFFVLVGLGGHASQLSYHDAFIYPGLALMLGGLLLDWRAQRLFRSKLRQAGA